MASLLPAVHGGAPILAMSGGSMSLLPQAPPVHIAGMHGGASLLPLGPDVPMIAMRGGADLLNMVSNRTIVQKENEIKKKSAAKWAAATFGITTTFSGDYATLHGLSDVSNCNPIEENKTIKVCESLQPFVDRRVQALLKRTSFPSGDTSFDMGCGTIARKGTTLTIMFHHKGITLLSSDLTGTFAKFHEGMRRHTPLSVEKSESAKGLLSWMLGSRVDEKGKFNLITFMERMKKENPVLPLKGFHRFLSYHKETVGEMDVLRYAMELYGYRTGAVDKDVYGLILSTDTAVRRVGNTFYIYTGGVMTSGSWDGSWNSDAGGFAVFEPTLVVAKTSGAAASASGAAASASAFGAATAASGATGASSLKPNSSSSTASLSTASSSALSVQDADHNILPVKSLKAAPFSSKKIEDIVTVGDIQQIGGKNYELRGMIYHQGGGDKGGHYIYFYRDPTNTTNSSKQWIRFDDENPPAYQARPTEINTGYVYLFERDGLNSKPDPKGISNGNNYCWANAALQMFYHIPEYRAYIQKFNDNNSPLPKDMIATTMIIKRIFELYTNAPSLGHAVCTPQHEQLATSLFQGNSTNQQDTMEFIRKVLLYIIAPLDNAQKKNGKHDDPVASKVYSYFTIQETSRTVCVTNISITPSEGSSIATEIPLSISEPSSLDKLLKKHYSSEKIKDATHIDGKDCDDVHRTITVTSLDSTKYVIIVLKRFEEA